MFIEKPSDVAKIAMEIEQNGLAFYKALAGKTDLAEAKALFIHMAEEEQAHYNTFEKLFDKFSSYEMPQLGDDEYDKYMSLLADNNVFSERAASAKLADEVNNPLEAIELALGFEKDAIVFFIQMKKVLPPEEKEVVDELIAEENRHIKKLLSMKRMLISTSADFYASQKTWDGEK